MYLCIMKQSYTFKFDSELLDQLRIEAESEDRPFNSYVERLLLTHPSRARSAVVESKPAPKVATIEKTAQEDGKIGSVERVPVVGRSAVVLPGVLDRDAIAAKIEERRRAKGTNEA